jgi:hypothetical protein
MHLDPVGASATKICMAYSSSKGGKDQGLLFDPKFLPPGYSVTPLLKRYNMCPIQKIRACEIKFDLWNTIELLNDGIFQT